MMMGGLLGLYFSVQLLALMNVVTPFVVMP